jgi:hypothetical protein
MTDSNRFTFTFTNSNPGVSTSNSSIQFKKINTDELLNELDLNQNQFLNIDSYSQLCYADLTDILQTYGSYSINFTITENITSDSTKPLVYLTIGKHLKNGHNDCFCVYKNTAGRVTFGFIQGSNFISETPYSLGISATEPGVEYIYTLAVNHLALGTDQRIRLYRKRSDEQLDSNNQLVNLIASSDVTTNIPTPYVFLGTSYTTLLPEWESFFDITHMYVKEVNVYLNEVLDPSFLPGSLEYPTTVSILNTDGTKNTPNAYCETGDTIELKFHSPRLVSPSNVLITTNGQQMTFIENKTISVTDENTNIYSSVEYTFQFVVTEQYPTNPFQYIVNFNGTLTNAIDFNTMYVLRSLPSITYEINNVTSSAVYFKLTSISDDFYDFYNLSYDNYWSLTFTATDGSHTTLNVSANTLAINSIFTIDSLNPVETIWTLTATITDNNIPGRTNTIAPTVNAFAVNGNINQILNGEVDAPEVSNGDVLITHTVGESFVNVLNIKSKDLTSSFSTYAVLFDSNTQTVTIDDIINAGDAIISQLNVPNTSDYVSLDGNITHFRKWNGTGWDAATELEYNKEYFLYVYSVDLSSNQNANTVFVESPFASVYVGYQNAFYDLGSETVTSAHILTTFSEKVAEDTLSTQYVGYDTSGNNNHILIELVDTNVSPIVASNGSINENVLSLSNVSNLLIPNPDYNIFLSNSSYTITFFMKKANWNDSVVIYDNYSKSAFITVTQNTIVINHSPSSTVFDINIPSSKWTNVFISYEANKFSVFIDAVQIVSSTGEVEQTYVGVSKDLYMNSTNVEIDELRIYNTKMDITIIELLVNSLTKTVELGFDTEGYVFNYDVIVNNDAIQINDDSVLHSFHLNGIYTFYQTNTVNSHPITLQETNTVNSNQDIIYYIDDVIVTRDEYITNFSANNNRKIVFSPTSISLSLNGISLTSTNENIPPLQLSLSTDDIVVKNKGNYTNPTFNTISYSTNAAVNTLAYKLDTTTSSLTFPSATVSPNFTVSTWAKINALPTDGTNYPIVHQNNVFEIGIDSLGRLYFDNFYQTIIRFEINDPSVSGNVTINEIELYDAQNNIIPYTFTTIKETSSVDILSNMTNDDKLGATAASRLEYVSAIADESLFYLQLSTNAPEPVRIKLYNYSCATTPGYNVYVNDILVSSETNEGTSTRTSSENPWIQDIYFNTHYNTFTYKIYANQSNSVVISLPEIRVYDMNGASINIGFVNINTQRKYNTGTWSGNDPNSLSDDNTGTHFDYYNRYSSTSYAPIGSTLFKLIFDRSLLISKVQIAYTRQDLSPGIETFYNGILLGTQENLGTSSAYYATFDLSPKHEIIIMENPTLIHVSTEQLLINLEFVISSSFFPVKSIELQLFNAEISEWNSVSELDLVYTNFTKVTYYAKDFGQSYQFRLLKKHVNFNISDMISNTVTITTNAINATGVDITTDDFEYSTTDSAVLSLSNSVLVTNGITHTLSKEVVDLPVYIECELKSLSDSVGIYITTSDAQISESPLNGNNLVWGTGINTPSRYHWGIHNVTNTYYNGQTHSEQYDSFAETYQKFAIYCDDKRAFFYKNDTIVYEFSKSTYPDLWTHFSSTAYGFKFGTFSSSSSEIKNFKYSKRAYFTTVNDIHSFRYLSFDSIMWWDGTYKNTRGDLASVQPSEVVLYTPHPLTNVTGTLRQAIQLRDISISFDTDNKMYILPSVLTLGDYQFLVDSTATENPYFTPNLFIEAVDLNNRLTSLYPGKTINKLHSLGDTTFLIEYDDRTLHYIGLYTSGNVTSQIYYSPSTNVSVTGLDSTWELHIVINLGWVGLVFMKRLGATAPYTAFSDQYTQYSKDDTSNGNNIRIFAINTAVAQVLLYNTGVPITNNYYDNQYFGILKASNTSATWQNTPNSSGSLLSYDNHEPLYLYWVVQHLKELLNLGFLPTKFINLRWSSIILFEDTNGNKEWHLANFGPHLTNETYNNKLRRTAQYLLLNNHIDGHNSGSTYFSTLGYPATRTTMLASEQFVRLQAVMAAAGTLGTGFDDLVFVNSSYWARYDNSTSNSTMLQVYVKSLSKGYQLSSSATMSEINWVEITSAFLDADAYDYMDFKNGTSYGIYGGNTRLHTWLFANNEIPANIISFDVNLNSFLIVTQEEAVTPASRTYDINTVSSTTTFNIEWNTMTEYQQREFENQFTNTLAASLNISADNVVISSVTSGSAIVNASVYITSNLSITTTEVTNKLTNEIIFTTGDVFGDTAPVTDNITTGVASVIGEKPKVLATPVTVNKGDVTLDSINIYWTHSSNNDAKLLNYAVLVDGNVVESSLSSNTTSYTITGLNGNTDYTIVVRKVTNVGNVDSSGVMNITRNVYYSGTRSDYFGNLANTSTFEKTTFFGENVSEIYSAPNEYWAIVKTLDGTYYSVGKNDYTSSSWNRLGLTNSIAQSTVPLYNDQLNNHNQTYINDPSKQIKQISLLSDGVVALLENGEVWYYGLGGRGMNSKTTFSEFILDSTGVSPYTSYLEQGWTIQEVYGFENSVLTHLVKDNEHKITFIGNNIASQFGFNSSLTSSSSSEMRENTVLNSLLEGKSVLGINIFYRLLKINIDGAWYGMGDHAFCQSYKVTDSRYTETAANWTGRIWTADDIANLWASENLSQTDPVELEYLNSFLSSLPSDSYLLKTEFYFTGIYTPSTGQLHVMSPSASSGTWGNYSSIIKPRTYFMEVTQLNLNNIGVANDLQNLEGDFVSFTSLRYVSVFITQTGSELATVKTLIPPSPPIIQVSTLSDTSKEITWSHEDNGDSNIEKYIILLDGSVYVDNISPLDTSYTAIGLPLNTSYDAFRVRKVTDLGSVDSLEPRLVTLKAHYDFTTDTLDEQVTGNSAYTLFQENTTYGYQFVNINGTRWLNPVRKCSLVSPIGPLLPTQNFTWMIRYYAPYPFINQYGTLQWWSSFGEVPGTADACDIFKLDFRAILGVEPNLGLNPNAPIRLSVDPVSHTNTRMDFKPQYPGETYHDGSTINIEQDFAYEHVVVGVCNMNQIEGTDLAAQPGTIALYIDNKLCTTIPLADDTLQSLNFNDTRYFNLRTDRQQAEMYFQSVKLFDGVVDISTLNELSNTIQLTQSYDHTV